MESEVLTHRVLNDKLLPLWWLEHALEGILLKLDAKHYEGVPPEKIDQKFRVAQGKQADVYDQLNVINNEEERLPKRLSSVK